jgi:uncharacterized protein YrzB (UPF0473 family)
MDDIFITLYGANAEEILYKVDRIFAIDGSANMYCAVVPADCGEDVIFLRCSLVENGEETSMSVFDIKDTAEYSRVAAVYNKNTTKAVMDAAYNELAENEDYITVTDTDGNKTDFIVHTIFDDEQAKRSYVAVQRVDEAGDIDEEISLYRFEEDEDGNAVLDMIPSSMEYERVRKLFMDFIETP